MVEKQGFAIWLTGLPASGKSTLAKALADALDASGLPTQILDSDELRAVLTPQPTYSERERDWFYATLVYLARLLTENGVNVLLAATATRRAYRERGRKSISQFMEVYVRCSLETAMARDSKGTYTRALAGEATTVPGVQIPYEAPRTPDVLVNTEFECVEVGVARILDKLHEQRFGG